MIDKLELQAQQLFITWTRHFRQQDLALALTHTEQAKILSLGNNVMLVGIVDAEGDDFFAEYKTANPRSAKTWKREWLMSTQALTYGLLTGGTKRFLVRKIFKAVTPFCDSEWFEFNVCDLQRWREQIVRTAHEIRAYKLEGFAPWPLNYEHGCFAYGPNYPCPFWEHGCTQHNYNDPIPGALPYTDFPEFTGQNALTLAAAIQEHPDALWLSSTRLKSWQRCREMFRRLQTMSFPPSEAMLLGSRFHELVHQYNAKLIAARLK